MSTALYRRYRPSSFAEVIGQDHVTGPLRQALRTGRINHAYLFSGPRGCGKTTSARILARCLNCEEGPTDTPCGVCRSCMDLAAGGSGSVDVIEIDAASHGGVDDARELRERASYGPAGSRYKVYIIDEAHMVTPQGFNALLKIVEEPPEHVKFVFATTEPDKVIGTIRSRTHHYPFHLVPPSRLQPYLEELCVRESVQVEPGVLGFVVRAGGGSVRDSLSVLDQLMAGAGPGGVTYAGAAALLGFTEDELVDSTVEALAARDGGAVFRCIHKVMDTGHDPRRFVEDLLERFRDLIIVSAVPDDAASVLQETPPDQLERRRHQAAGFGKGELSHMADVINRGLTEMSGATAPRLHVELLCARLLLPAADGADGVLARLDRLERRLAAGGVPDSSAGGQVGAGHDSAPEASTQSPTRTAGRASGASRALAEARRVAAQASGSMQESVPVPGRTVDAPQTPGQTANALEQRADAPNESAAGSLAGAGVVGQDAGVQSPPVAQHNPSTIPLTAEALRLQWPGILDRLSRSSRATWSLVSMHAHILSFDGSTITLEFATSHLAASFSQGDHRHMVQQAVFDHLALRTHLAATAKSSQSSEHRTPQTSVAPPHATPASTPEMPVPAGESHTHAPVPEQHVPQVPASQGKVSGPQNPSEHHQVHGYVPATTFDPWAPYPRHQPLVFPHDFTVHIPKPFGTHPPTGSTASAPQPAAQPHATLTPSPGAGPQVTATVGAQVDAPVSLPASTPGNATPTPTVSTSRMVYSPPSAPGTADVGAAGPVNSGAVGQADAVSMAAGAVAVVERESSALDTSYTDTPFTAGSDSRLVPDDVPPTARIVPPTKEELLAQAPPAESPEVSQVRNALAERLAARAAAHSVPQAAGLHGADPHDIAALRGLAQPGGYEAGAPTWAERSSQPAPSWVADVPAHAPAPPVPDAAVAAPAPIASAPVAPAPIASAPAAPAVSAAPAPTAPAAPTPTPIVPAASPQAPARTAPAPAASAQGGAAPRGRSAFLEARQAIRENLRTPKADEPAADDAPDTFDVDDLHSSENARMDDLTTVGRPVIEKVLGGVVIQELNE